MTMRPDINSSIHGKGRSRKNSFGEQREPHRLKKPLRLSSLRSPPQPIQMLDQPSNEKLALVMPALSAKVNAAAAALATQGIYFRVAQGLRTYAIQQALYMQSRTTPPTGPRVTDAPAGYSPHNFGYAVDCFPFLHGSSGDLEMKNPHAPVFLAMIAALKAQGLAWGGDWRRPDSPHFQLANAPTTPTDEDRTAFAARGLPAVWARYA